MMWSFVEKILQFLTTPVPPYPKPKIFKPKCPQIPLLKSYCNGGSSDFWTKFPKNEEITGKSPYKLDGEQILQRAITSGVTDLNTVKQVVNDIKFGCDLKVDKNKCKPTKTSNAPSAYKDGQKVTDALATWIQTKIVAGPFDEPPANAIVNSIQTKDKPNGSCRIIINQSAPKYKSVNDCLDKKAYNSYMGGVPELLRALNYCGRDCLFSKVDWNNAYKHFWVKEDNLRYNWFRWLNKYFVELCLVFGCVSSVGLYDRGNRVLVWIALRESGFPVFLAIQHLDDLCAVGPSNKPWVHNFYRVYCQLCADVGVSLAPTTDPEKAFAPTTTGVMLGISFDSKEWVWWLSAGKMHRYINDIKTLGNSDEATLGTIQSVVGKILYICPLIPGSKYHVSSLHGINDYTGTKHKSDIIKITPEAKKELEWWLIMTRLCGNKMPIPTGHESVPPSWTLMGDSDASGGNCRVLGHGMGAVMGSGWAWVQWPLSMKNNKLTECCNIPWRMKMSFLEMNGHMLHLLAFATECENQVVATRIDNQGTVIMAKKCYDLKCPVNDCLIRTINYVAVAINCQAFVVDVRRCSSNESIAADAISKCNRKILDEVMPDREVDPRRVPRTYLKWLEKPKVDPDLGRRIVMELHGKPWWIEPFFPQ